MSRTSRFGRMGFAAVVAAAAAAAAIGVCVGSARADDVAPASAGPGQPVEPIAEGKFQPSWDSLKQYQVPDWFRDAKFGIWAHWTAQCVPEQGDWYARNMYVEGQHDYKFHLEHYGPQSKVGFKDIDHIWHAENWDPDKLIALYKAAGAQYFVALANHHDNFDCFDSKYQPWNSTKIGPMKDIVGGWEKAARAAGMHFGVTVHAGRTWNWFEVAQGADKSGPYAGIPYDGKLTKADGKGQWWDGLDPQDLYAQDHPLKAKPSKEYCDKFFNRTIDLINKYHPDLLYFDDSILPLRGSDEQYGLKIAAHLYNSNAALHDGQNQAVMNTKGLNEAQRQCLVWDIERGLADKIEPFAWQTDTCIGGWHYDVGVFERHRYKTADLVVHMLCDIVSKNGNLLLNIPVKGDGTIDADEVAFLEQMAPWMATNKECIFGTRPWKIYGEGPSTEAKPTTRKGGSNFNEQAQKYTPQDIRFTAKGDALYAIAFGWPDDGKLTIKSLAAGAANYPGEIGSVQLLGVDGDLKTTRDAGGLTIALPDKKPGDYAYAFKITPAAPR